MTVFFFNRFIRRKGADLDSIRNRVSLIVGLVAFMWAVELINLAGGHRLNVYGIMPRNPASLPGIIFAPFLHAGIAHVAANTAPLLILGVLVAVQARTSLVEVILVIGLAGGAGVWLIGRPAYHVGASGIIMGLFGFLIGNAYYRKSLLSVVGAFVALLLYGGSLWGVFPVVPEFSWEMHLCGLLAGLVAARLVHEPRAN